MAETASKLIHNHSNNSVICEVNHVKFEILVQGSWAHKSPTFVETGQGNSLPKSGNFNLLGPSTHPCAPIEVKFHRAKQTHVLCQISRGSVQRVAPAERKCRFLALSKFNPFGWWQCPKRRCHNDCFISSLSLSCIFLQRSDSVSWVTCKGIRPISLEPMILFKGHLGT